MRDWVSRKRPTGKAGRGMRGGGVALAAIIAVGAWLLSSSTVQLKMALSSPATRVDDHPSASAPGVVGAALPAPAGQGEASRAAGPKRQEARVVGSVQSAAGSPLSGANVCVLAVSNVRCASEPCVMSDHAGRFTVDSCGPGSILTVSAQGYLPQRQLLPPLRGKEPLVISLELGGVQVSGTVVDASGGPIAGALVSAAGADGPALGAVQTAPTGAFTLHVPAGMLALAVRADGYSSATRAVEAPDHGIQLVLTAASSVSGRVLVRETRRPVPDVQVRLFNEDGLPLSALEAITDQQGAFRLGDLPAGTYSAMAASTEWRGERSRLVLDVAEDATLDLFVASTTRLTGRVHVEGAPCERGRVELSGPASGAQAVDARGEVEFGVLPGAYTARITCESGLERLDQFEVGSEPLVRDWQVDRGLGLTGVVLTSAGAPLAGGRVQVYPVGEPSSSRGVVCSSSDEQGAFACVGLEPGEYECQLREGLVGRSERVRVTLSADSDPPKVSLRAAPSASLRVRIEDADSLDLNLLSVIAQPKGMPPSEAQRKGDEFVFEQLQLGTYDVLIDPEVAGARRAVTLSSPDVTLELSLTVPAARKLSGRVVDERGAGVPDVWVRVMGASSYGGGLLPAAPVLSDADGAFVVSGLLPSSYHLEAMSSRGQAHLDQVLNDGRPLIVSLRGFELPR